MVQLLQPHEYPRRILLCVTGMSPQIVTETLYALAVTKTPPFLPTEIHLLTTVDGARLAKAALLHPDGGHFHALLKDQPKIGFPRFDEDCIHIISHNQQKLADIRTSVENAAAADTIMALVAQFTTDADAALHVSIAGGRKTMGFYLGYAFSLFARQQDNLSHILVSSPFEGHPDFFYPPRQPRRLVTRDGYHVDTAEAEVTLAEIPVVRLRHGLPATFITGQAGFGETVVALQQSFAPPHLLIDLEQRSVMCGAIAVALKPQLLAWLTWWAMLAKRKQPETTWREADVKLFLDIYRFVIGIDAFNYEKTAELLSNGMEKEFFQTKNSKMERTLRNTLGLAATPYLLVTVGKRPHTRRGLSLSPDNITIIGASFS